jgi:hypothetical protein
MRHLLAREFSDVPSVKLLVLLVALCGCDELFGLSKLDDTPGQRVTGVSCAATIIYSP